MEARSSVQILEYTSDAGVAKSRRTVVSLLILGVFAGAFIAFAAEGSNMAAFNLFANPETYGLGKVLAGTVFGTGLMLVLVAGGELFTGNTLILVSVLDKKVKIREMLRNWALVYIGNFIGSIFIAYMMCKSGLLNSGNSVLGGQTIKIAAYKTGLPFLSAFYLGVMCNWLVCLAVWVSFAAKDVLGKLFACFFVIGLFVTSGFEHSIANMYYIPAGIFAKANEAWAETARVSSEQLANLNWFSFVVKNLIPVTAGNIIGGSVMVGGLYWAALKKKSAAAPTV
ncbi:MAG: formate/nitrite transporter family protein [Spirochaetaceae bacterium]|jgi:formate/nitrite transporter|nr:formate/nitrite transporter family protein [Spirochaetaceae bacterium]